MGDIPVCSCWDTEKGIQIILIWKRRSLSFPLVYFRVSWLQGVGILCSPYHKFYKIYLYSLAGLVSFKFWSPIIGVKPFASHTPFFLQSLLIIIIMFWPPSPLLSLLILLKFRWWLGAIFSFLSKPFLPSPTFRHLMQSDWFYWLLNTSEMARK